MLSKGPGVAERWLTSMGGSSTCGHPMPALRGYAWFAGSKASLSLHFIRVSSFQSLGCPATWEGLCSRGINLGPLENFVSF